MAAHLMRYTGGGQGRRELGACGGGAEMAHSGAMSIALAQLEFCRTLAGEALLAAPLSADGLLAQKALRKVCGPAEARAVMEVRQVRQRAAESGRFPPQWTRRLLATDTMLQQASSARLAVWVGRRLAALAGGGPVYDLGCGLGADAIGSALAGARVLGFDLSGEAVLCAMHNAGVAGVGERCRFEQADAADVLLPGDAVVHVDPDRRATGRRSTSLEGCSPSSAFLKTLPGRTRAGAIKLSPATDAGVVADWPCVRTEHLSEDGVCKQLLLWWGDSADTPPARATVVDGPWDDPVATTLPAGLAEPAEVRDQVGAWLVEPDPAVVAARAVDDLAALLGTTSGRCPWRIARGLDWLFADEPCYLSLGRSYRILEQCPGREPDIRRALNELGAGVVEVKPRGVRLDTDAVQARLRGRGDRLIVVLWGRVGRSQRAFLAERLSPQAGRRA